MVMKFSHIQLILETDFGYEDEPDVMNENVTTLGDENLTFRKWKIV